MTDLGVNERHPITELVCSECGGSVEGRGVVCGECMNDPNQWRENDNAFDRVETFVRTKMTPVHMNMILPTLQQARLKNDADGGAK